MCFGPGTLSAGAKTRLGSRIRKLMPHCVCRPWFCATIAWHELHSILSVARLHELGDRTTPVGALQPCIRQQHPWVVHGCGGVQRHQLPYRDAGVSRNEGVAVSRNGGVTSPRTPTAPFECFPVI